MKVSILSKTVCPASQAIIEYFVKKEYRIDSVIIENNFRHKFSKRERQYRQTRDKFNRKTKKYSLVRRLARHFWNYVPTIIKKFILQKIYFLPILNIFSLNRFCKKKNIKVIEVSKHSSEETRQIILNRGIDYLLLVSSNWLLKEPIISIKGIKIINAHSGWLPKHKGLDSIPWSLKENDKVGLTTHFINVDIDSGAILQFYEAKIAPGDSFNTINRKVGDLQPKAFYDTITKLERDEIIPIAQNDKYKPHSPITYEELWEIEQKLTSHNTKERIG